MLFVGITTITAALLNIKNIYLPQAGEDATLIPGLINLILTVSILICVAIIFYNAVPKWVEGFKNQK
jgi:hypothetical protein